MKLIYEIAVLPGADLGTPISRLALRKPQGFQMLK
jgi:hypothetical protein